MPLTLYTVLAASGGWVNGIEVAIGAEVPLTDQEAQYEVDLGSVAPTGREPPQPPLPPALLPTDLVETRRDRSDRDVPVASLDAYLTRDGGALLDLMGEREAGLLERLTAQGEGIEGLRRVLLGGVGADRDTLAKLSGVLDAKVSRGRTAVADADYQALVGDAEIGLTRLTVSRTVTLPAAAAYPVGQPLAIADLSGQCGPGRRIVIAPAPGDSLPQMAGAVLALVAARQRVVLYRGDAPGTWLVETPYTDLASPYVLGGTSLYGQLRGANQDPIALDQWTGRAFDGLSTPQDNHDVLAEVLTKAGRAVELPSRRLYVGAELPQIVNTTVSLHGRSRAETLVFASGVRGLSIAQADYSFRTAVTGVTFESLSANEGSGYAVAVAYSDADAVLNVDQTRVVLRDLTFGGFYNQSQGWGGGIDLYNVNSGQIHNVYGYGRVNRSATSPLGRYCNMRRLIRMRCGDTFGLGLMSLFNINGNAMDAMIEIAGGRSIEGIQIVGLNAVSTRIGLLAAQAAGSPGLVVAKGHFNVFEAGVRAAAMPEAIFTDLLVYKHPESSAETVCVELTKASDFCRVSFTAKNQTADPAVSGGFVGLRLADSSYGAYDVMIERPSLALDLSGTSTRNDGTLRVRGFFGPSPALIRDTSTGSNNVRLPECRVTVADADYLASPVDTHVALTSLTASRTVTLPDPDGYPPGQILTVSDDSGAASDARLIAIVPLTGDTIDGAAGVAITSPNQRVKFRPGRRGSGTWFREV